MRGLLFSLAILFGKFLFAQESKLITHFKHLEVKNGLPENDVKEFIADEQNGYWFRTTNYIVYYNGHDFINYGKNKSLFSISNSEIKSFNLQGNFIYVFGNAGVDKINCSNKRSEQIFKDTVGIGIKAGYVTRKGHILIVCQNGDVVQVLPNKIRKLFRLEIFAFCSIKETNEGDILVSNVKQDIAIFSPELKLLNHVRFPEPVLLNGHMQVTQDVGTIIGANRRVFQYNKTTHNFKKLVFKHELRRLFLHTPDQNFTVVGYNQVQQHDLRTNRSISLDINLNYNYYINKLDVDKNKTLVLCTNQGIVLYKMPLAFVTYPIPQTLESVRENTTRRSILETDDGKILFVNYGRTIEYDPVTGANKRFSKDSIDGYAAVFLKDNLWIGSDGTGLYWINNKTRSARRDTSYIPQFKEYNMHITALKKLRDSTLLLGLSGSASNLKTYNINQRKYKNFHLKGWRQELLTEKVSAIVESGGTIWICSAAGLIELANNEVKLFLDQKVLGTNFVNYVYPESARFLWIATDAGLVKFDRKANKVIRKITEKEGLSGNKCISILSDNYNTLWVPTYTGLSRVDQRTGVIWNYYMQDGLTDNEYNYASFLRASNGDIYLGGLNGFVRIRPDVPRPNENISASIRLDYAILYKKYGEELIDLTGATALKMNDSYDRLNISFSINEHLSPEYIRYFYKIEGLHRDWIELDRQNKIDLAYLPAGKYSLKIKSAFLENKSTFYERSIPLIVTTYWYETKAFYFFIAFLLVFSIIGFIYYKLSASRELNKLRTSLANDIHDEIGTMLTKAIMRLELLTQKKIVEKEELTGVENQLRGTILSFRNVLWSLNADNAKTIDFVGRLNSLLQEVFADTRFEFIITNLSPNIYFKKSIFVKRNLLLIVNELANNTLKYSNGNLFEVVIRSNGGRWIILIADNGNNENTEIGQTGVGLQSVKKRVESMNGSVVITKEQKGFFVNIYL